jgi:membrane fusion protein
MGDAVEKLQLQSGMRVEADLLHETRRLYEWVLEPIYAARSRL